MVVYSFLTSPYNQIGNQYRILANMYPLFVNAGADLLTPQSSASGDCFFSARSPVLDVLGVLFCHFIETAASRFSSDHIKGMLSILYKHKSHFVGRALSLTFGASSSLVLSRRAFADYDPTTRSSNGMFVQFCAAQVFEILYQHRTICCAKTYKSRITTDDEKENAKRSQGMPSFSARQAFRKEIISPVSKQIFLVRQLSAENPEFAYPTQERENEM